jgi:hypothetical protein
MHRIQAMQPTATRSAYREKNWSLDGVLNEVSLHSKVTRTEWRAMMMNSHKRFAELADGLNPLGAL